MQLCIKKSIVLSVITFFLLIQDQSAFSLDIKEKLLPADFKILSIVQDAKTSDIYLGGRCGLYLLTNNSIKKFIMPAGVKAVKSISITKNKIYCVFDDGLFMKDIKDPDAFWQRKYEIKDPAGVYTFEYDEDQILIWNKKTIYRIDPVGVEKIKGVLGEEIIVKVKTVEDRLYVLTNRGCMVMNEVLKTWKKILSIKQDSSEMITEDMDSGDLSGDYGLGYQAFSPDFDSDGTAIVVTTLSGVKLFDINSGKLEVLNLAGVPVSDIKYVAIKGNSVFLATSKKLYHMGRSTNTTKEIILSNGITDLSLLYVSKIDGNIYVWTGGDNKLYKVRISEKDFTSENSNPNYKRVVSIKEVQSMAIEYAEVDPEKITKWRRAAKLKAILPKVSLGISESNDENVEIYKSATKHYVVNGPSEVDRDWSIGFSWDLSDLIWNDAQTSIDVRSKLMVQMRNDILEEVTRLYFERMRLIGEINMITGSADKDQNKNIEKKKMRIEEITAYIDAYTGGKFSENLFSGKT